MFGDTLSELRKWDVKATLPQTGVSITFECKRDRMAWHTGNVACEHRALLHSEADLIVYMLDQISEDLHQIGHETLLSLLKENWIGKRRWRVIRGGERSDYMTLIPVKEFIALCNPINKYQTPF